MKRIILIVFTGLLIWACQDKEQYWEINGIAISYMDSKGQTYYSDTIQAQQLYVSVNFDHLYTANLKQSNPFIQEAYANEPGTSTYGLKHSISKLIVTTTKDFNGIKAGDDISSKLLYCGEASYAMGCQNINLQNYIYNVFVQESPPVYQSIFRFTEKPIDPEIKLTFRFIDSQGKEFVGTSNTIYWK